MESAKKAQLLLVLGIILLAANMRAPLTSVGALAGGIQSNTGLSKTAVGFLTTIPLIMFSLASFSAAFIIKKIGIIGSVIWGIALILLGETIRSYTAIPGLFAGTFLIGIGIGLENVLVLAVIKKFFAARIRIMTSLYTSVMSLFGGAGSWLSIYLLSRMAWSWDQILSVWIPIILVTLVIWVLVQKYSNKRDEIHNVNQPNIKFSPKKKLYFYLTVFVGIQSLLFYCFLSWLPSILTSLGADSNFLGLLIFLNQTISIPSGFIIPIIAGRKKSTPLLIVASGVFLAGGILILLIFRQPFLLLIGVISLAIGLGSSFSMGVVLINLKTENSEESSMLAGFALSVGYLLASIGPFLIGFTYDQFNSWAIPLFSLLLFVGLMVGVGLKVES